MLYKKIKEKKKLQYIDIILLPLEVGQLHND